MRLLCAGLCLLAACSPSPSAPAPPSSNPAAPPTATIPPANQAAIDEGLRLLTEHSYYASRSDALARREIAYRIAAGWQDPIAVQAALEAVLRVVGDRHGYVLTPAEADALSAATTADARPPRGDLLAGRVGYLLVPEFASGRADQQVAYASNLQALVQEVDAARPCAWLIDLRGNLGGSMWAMLPALGAFLGDSPLGAFVDAGGRSQSWDAANGRARLAGEVMVALPEPVYSLARPDPPLAVLIDGLTISSGEAVLVSFLGRPETRVFGQPTGGYTTAIEGFPLPDGSLLGISTAVFADRAGRTYPGPIQPDVFLDLPTDGSVPLEAIEWLLARPACANP